MGLTKLVIEAYSSEKFSRMEHKGTFNAQINPEQITHNKHIEYNEQTKVGASAPTPKFSNYGKDTVKFDLYFDGTGVIPEGKGVTSGGLLGKAAGMAKSVAKSAMNSALGAIGMEPNSKNIHDDIVKFEEVIFDYKGKIHQPNYLKIKWSTFVFKCRVKSISTVYTLFRPDGSPLRAKVSLSFVGYIDEETREKEANKSSPDLTHVKSVREGDQLYLLCNEVYESPNYYLQIARENNILNFRQLKPGTKLVFPPLER